MKKTVKKTIKNTTANDSGKEKIEAIYVRVANSDNIDSLKTQIELCKAHVENPATAKIYSDIGYTGNLMERPGMAKMLFDVHNGIVETVTTCSLSRLSRSLSDIFFLKSYSDKAGVKYRIIDSGTDEPFGLLEGLANPISIGKNGEMSLNFY